jgi:ubiquinone/menaquinone biosynthesis C-methylase UbiE
MNGLAVRFVLTLNSFFPTFLNLHEIDSAKTSVQGYQQWEQEELQKLIPEFGRFWNLKNRRVLDLGCGLGGKTVTYSQFNPDQVVGLDLRFHSLESAQTLKETVDGTEKVQFCLGDAACMPFPDNSFDIIVSINVLEHIEDLYFALQECKRVLRPEGVMLFHFPPFFSPWGAHLEGWINVPWLHLFFPDQVLIEAARNIERKQQRNRNYIPTAQVNWSTVNRLPELNRITVSQFLHLIKAVDLKILHMRMLPLGRHYFAKRGKAGQLVEKILAEIANLPLFREIISTKMVFVLTKNFAE